MVSLTSISLNNSIGIITLDDNTIHKYFTKIIWEQDNDTPTGYAQATIPYHKDLLKYWLSYHGVVIIHAQLMKEEGDDATIMSLPNSTLESKTIDKVTTEKEDNQIKITNKEYNYSFIGHISKVKHIGMNIVLKIHDIGWKFMQKVPIEFRKAYIAGQPLDQAFKAICEFIGVEFAYSTEDLSAYSFSSDGYSIEKDGTIIEEVPSFFSQFQTTDMEEPEDEYAEVTDELTNAIDDANNQQSKTKTKKPTDSLNSGVTNNKKKTNESGEEEEETDENEEDFHDKIRDLFIGNTIYDSNIVDAILNYDAITVEVKAVTSSSMSTVEDSSQSTEQNKTTEENEENK